MVFRLIVPKWHPKYDKYGGIVEDTFDLDKVHEYNIQGYNCYFYPNFPSTYDKSAGYITASDIDVFTYVFVDMDLKDNKYKTKEEFLTKIQEFTLAPSTTVDSGNGMHVYWVIDDLDAMSFLRFQRRLCRYFNTDPAVSKLNQLMRVPGTLNTKKQHEYKECRLVATNDVTYSSETLDKALPLITLEDEQYCSEHYIMATDPTRQLPKDVSEDIPESFLKLVKNNPEASKLFYGYQKDRSSADYRLAHLMLAGNIAKKDALSVLMNTAKAVERRPRHRLSYASNIVDKVYLAAVYNKTDNLSKSVKDILLARTTLEHAVRLPNNQILDSTYYGFRLGQVFGLIGGSGNGKTAFGLNMIAGFAELNPQYIHIICSLEQPRDEIADLWLSFVKENEVMLNCVHILDNYDDSGTYRNLSLTDIKNYVIELEKQTGRKVGCVMIDHVGILRQEKSNDERGGLIGVFKQMKEFALATKTFLVMQSQTTREKNGEGDIELNMDAAYGGVQFESYADFIATIWQPLKRVYVNAPHMTVTAFKYCKIRKKDIHKDKIKQDQVYLLKFEPGTGKLRKMYQDEMKEFDYLNQQATLRRGRDRKKETSAVSTITWIADKEVTEEDKKWKRS